MSQIALELLAALVKSVIIIAGLLGAFAYLTLIERRVLARFQRRVGPNRLGPFGLLQPIADALKMVFKEQIIPTQAKTVVFLLAPTISIFVAITAFGVVPLGDKLGSLPSYWQPALTDINVGVLYILAMSSLAVYGIVLGGWSSGNKYSLLGALRSAAQMVSYEVSIAISLSGVIMLAGTLSMIGIVHQQTSQHIWFILAQPLGFVLYGIAALAEVNRAPFDLPEAEQELTAGYLTEYSGLRWSLYQMSEYINMITTSSVLTTLYLGGWTFFGLENIPGLSILIFIVKVALFLFVFMWLRATLPRIRYDMLMKLGWQVLMPLSVLNLLVTAYIVAFQQPWWIAGVFGLITLLIAGYAAAGEMRPKKASVVTEGVALPSSVRLVKVESTPPPETAAIS